MVRWLALSLGIINPGETRLSAIYVLDAMLYFQFQKKQDPNVEELSEYISKSWQPINEKTLRYHLLQLKIPQLYLCLYKLGFVYGWHVDLFAGFNATVMLFC